MKSFLQKLKIKHKLIIIIMSTVVFSLLLVGSVLIVSENYLARQSMSDKLITISKIIADRSTAALSFKDKSVANEVLSALDNETSVEFSCIYDKTNFVFAEHGYSISAKCPKVADKTSHYFLGDRFELYQAVKLEGKVIGTVYISATLEKLNDRVLKFIMLVFVMVMVVAVVAYFLAKRQQEIISKPIQELTEVTKKISVSGDYTTRLARGSDDEIGALNLEFNNMLEQIQKRETERDKAEKSLSEREQDLVVTLNSIGDAVIVTDINGKITRMNPVAEKLTGWMYEDANQQSIKNIFPIIDAATQEPIDNPLVEVVSTGETVFLKNHTMLITKAGRKIHIADSAAPIRNDKKEILGMILVFNDVTVQYKLREAAAKSKRDLQAIMDNSPSAIHVEDKQGEFIFVNQGFENVFNIQNKMIVGKRIDEVFSRDIADAMLKNNNEVLSVGQILEVEENVPQEDGEHFYSTIKFPLYDEKNSIYAVCSISTDITDRRQQEEQLRVSQKMDALGKLTGGIAHDYNNLLGVIMGYSEILSEKLSSEPKLMKYVNDIEHAAERGAKLTRKLLAFTSHKSSDESVLNINKLILDQQLMLEKTLTARITLSMELEDNIWPIWIDSGDLEDAMINMCINASHAIVGNGKIIFKTENINLNETDAIALHLKVGNYIKMSVCDTGMGMEKSIREKIFDPFFSTKGEAGTGLGLSQVYGFVKRSGGEIEVESEHGKGTCFIIYFPKSNKALVEVDNISEIKKEKSQGNEVILVVDDEVSLGGLAKDILEPQGYSVITANSGKMALDILKKEKIDLMITDIIMPKMDGYQLAEKVQKTYPNIIIQLASGFSDKVDKSIENEKLQKDLLYKPYTSVELLEKIRKLLEKNRKDYNHFESINNETTIDIVDAEKHKDVELKNSTILIMDDEEDIRELFVLSLEMLGYRAITASSSSEALEIYNKSLQEGEPITALILDLNIPGSMRGDEVAMKVRKINSDAKLIVCSGDSAAEEMTDYNKFGFDGALEKTFNRTKIKSLFEKLSIT